MDFRSLAWSAFCFYYRSVGDRKYIKQMSDKRFISSLQKNPSLVSLKEFENKVVMELINIYDWHLLIKHNLAGRLLERIVKMQPELSMLEGATILNCNLDDEEIITKINDLYFELKTVSGIWSTGASKILHLLIRLQDRITLSAQAALQGPPLTAWCTDIQPPEMQRPHPDDRLYLQSSAGTAAESVSCNH